MSSPPTIAEVAAFLERWAPLASAQSYDNVGLQIGDPSLSVSTGLIALDMTPGVLEEARSIEASLVITHHPLIFQPLRHLTTRTFGSYLALRLAESGIALYSIHTNLDAAHGGVSFALAETLGIEAPDFLDSIEEDGRRIGLGAIGELREPLPLEAFLRHVSGALGADSVRYTADPKAMIQRVAVCGGAGADFVGAALAAGADAYVTSDVKYHAFFDVLDNDGRARMAFVDAGHYETEAMTERLLRDALVAEYPAAEWRTTSTRTSPVRSFAAPR